MCRGATVEHECPVCKRLKPEPIITEPCADSRTENGEFIVCPRTQTSGIDQAEGKANEVITGCWCRVCREVVHDGDHDSWDSQEDLEVGKAFERIKDGPPINPLRQSALERNPDGAFIADWVYNGRVHRN